MAVGAFYDNYEGSVSFYQYNTTDNQWQKIGNDIQAIQQYSRFGQAVQLSGDGNTVAVGAPYHDYNTTISYSGAVMVYSYQESTGSWTKKGETIEFPIQNLYLGEFHNELSISGDGNILAIGIPRDPTISSNYDGRVRVYQFNNGNWVLMGAEIPGPENNDKFGAGVSLSHDGQTLAIGAPGRSVNAYSDGALKIFQYINGAWTQKGSELHGDNLGNSFGNDVSLSGDGNIVASGAMGYDEDTPTNSNSREGRVKVFQYTDGSWAQLGSAIVGEAYDDQSGISIELSDDGMTIAIGSSLNNGTDPSHSNAGHVRVYRYTNNDWNKVFGDIDGEGDGDESGRDIGLSCNGEIVAVGALYNDNPNGNNAGHVRVFEVPDATGSNASCYENMVPTASPTKEPTKEPTALPTTTPTALPTGAPTTAAPTTVAPTGTPTVSPTLPLYSWTLFGQSIEGSSISLSNDGQRMAVGDPDFSISDIGSTNIYEYTSAGWSTLGQSILGQNDGDRSGEYVSISGNGSRVATRAPHHDGYRGNTRVYQYNISYNQWQQVGSDIDGKSQNENFNVDDFRGKLSLSNDGSTVAFGGPMYDNNGVSNAGYVRVLKYNSVEWVQMGSDIYGESTNDYFGGGSLSLSSNGSVLAVGVPHYGNEIGRVYIYKYNSTDWEPMGGVIDGAADYNRFGKQVSLSHDGSIVAASSPHWPAIFGVSIPEQGRIRVFTYAAGSWVQRGGSIEGTVESEMLGYTMAMSGDGYLILTNTKENNNDAIGIYNYSISDNSWSISEINSLTKGLSLSQDGSHMCSVAPGSSEDTVQAYRLALTTPNPTMSPSMAPSDSPTSPPPPEGFTPYPTSSPSLSPSREPSAAPTPTPTARPTKTPTIQQNYTIAWNQVGSDIHDDTVNDKNGYIVSLSSDGTVLAASNMEDDKGTLVYGYENESWVLLGSALHDPIISRDEARAMALSGDGQVCAYLPVMTSIEEAFLSIFMYNASLQTWVMLGSRINIHFNVNFGHVSLSFDGKRVAVGGDGQKAGQYMYEASVYDFDETSKEWAQVGDFVNFTTSTKEGNSLALSADGQVLAISGQQNKVNIYKYNKPLSSWDMLGDTLQGLGLGSNDHFGWSVSLSSDGSIVAIGAPQNYHWKFIGDTYTLYDEKGYAVVYKYNYGTLTWEMMGSVISGQFPKDFFGVSVSLSHSGHRLAVGAHRNDGSDPTDTNRGHARLYEYDHTGTWVQIAPDIVGDAEDDESATSVSLSCNGETLAVGAYKNNGSDPVTPDNGHVRVFRLSDAMGGLESCFPGTVSPPPNESSEDNSAQLGIIIGSSVAGIIVVGVGVYLVADRLKQKENRQANLGKLIF